MNQIDRIPPQAVDVERTVIGSMLIDSEAAAEATGLLNSMCFYSPANKHIFNCMSDMIEKNIPIDVVTIAEELRKRDLLEAVGDEMYLADIAGNITTASNIEYYCGILKEKSDLRRCITIAGEVSTGCFSPDADPKQIIDTAEAEFFSITDGVGISKVESTRELLPRTFEEIGGYAKGINTGIKTGFKNLDEKTCGLQNSDLIIIAGRPSMGKTAFVLSASLSCTIKYGLKVIIFSLEMSKSQLMQRMLCSEARVNIHALRAGTLPKRDLPKLSFVAGPISEAGIYIDDTPSVTVSHIRSKSRRQKKLTGIDMIVIDYMQLMSGKGENRQQEVSNISRGLKGVAKELDVPVIALSQLSRALESRAGDKRPQLSDLRESGAIEQDADVVMFVYRDEVYNKDDESNSGTAEIIIAKQRNGPLGTARLAFVKEFARFENLAEQSDDPYESFRGGE